MFERFTDRARQVVVLAQDESRQLQHSYIGTEHLLLGLLRDGEGPAAAVLMSFDVELPAVRARVEEVVGTGAEPPGEHRHMPFTPRAKMVLELSLREAKRLGHESIDAGHILLGLLREGQGLAVHVLADLGADLREVRRATVTALGGEPMEGRFTSGPMQARAMVSGRMVARMDELENHLAGIEARLDAIEELLRRLVDGDPPETG